MTAVGDSIGDDGRPDADETDQAGAGATVPRPFDRRADARAEASVPVEGGAAGQRPGGAVEAVEAVEAGSAREEDAAGAAGAVVGGEESVSAGGRALAEADRWVDERFDTLRGRPAADAVMYTATRVGEHGLVWLALAGVLLVQPARRRKAVRLLVWLGIESALVNGPLKRSIGRTRPEMVGEHAYKIRVQTSSSFPSGHSASSACMATLLSEGSRLWPLWWAAALTIALSRVHVRDHHASDVAGGLAIGTAIGLLGRRLGPRDR
ncbi:MAG: phosphatase PAP2 family protein [Acidimicrobiales bacterium]|nr:phosphatase PAP2 family protein [Acidimicrobiales bacterium]